jgi:LuxR family maltose regulon positive regulatory protein
VLVPRPRLVEHLTNGLNGPLTLIAAPAGYGKTTLLSEWHSRAGENTPVAWLSLDGGDTDLARFLLYLSAAFNTVQPDLPQNTGLLLQSPQLPPTKAICTALINELNVFPAI